MSRQIIAETEAERERQRNREDAPESINKLLALYQVDRLIETCPCIFGGVASASAIEAALRKAADAGLGWQGLRLTASVVSGPNSPMHLHLAREALTRAAENIGLSREPWEGEIQPDELGGAVEIALLEATSAVAADVARLREAGIGEADTWPDPAMLPVWLSLDPSPLADRAAAEWATFGRKALTAIACSLRSLADVVYPRGQVPPDIGAALADASEALMAQADALQQAADAEAEGGEKREESEAGRPAHSGDGDDLDIFQVRPADGRRLADLSGEQRAEAKAS